MIVEFDKSFLKSLSKINKESALRKIKKNIFELEDTKDLINIRNIKKLTGYKNYYRIRIGDYRIGIESID